ncbi:MAG: peptidylprolyl isomerase [Chlorobi bacterium]|nr:peptidylprolyl isomerase [Chlorobiota bacterium]
MKKLIFFIGVLLLAASCNNDDDNTFDPTLQAEIDDQVIQDYLKTQPDSIQDNVIRDPSGIYYVILKEGTGEHPDVYSTVYVYYKGWLMETGELFEDHSASVAVFNLSGLIRGWQIGIPKLDKQGKGIFYIPSGLAYGPDGSGTIPPNSVLIFEIYLADFE